MAERRIGILGGTFDPIHRGHLLPLISAAAAIGWERILLVPAARQPFKAERPGTSAFHRWAMAAIATASDARIFLSTVEVERGETSYTVDTLEALAREYPGVALDWVIGDDNLPLLLQWRRIERIFDLANFVVVRRLGSSALAEALEWRMVRDGQTLPRAGGIIMVENPEVAVSSTEIREMVRRGESLEGVVEPGVAAYITKYRLYAEKDGG